MTWILPQNEPHNVKQTTSFFFNIVSTVKTANLRTETAVTNARMKTKTRIKKQKGTRESCHWFSYVFPASTFLVRHISTYLVDVTRPQNLVECFSNLIKSNQKINVCIGKVVSMQKYHLFSPDHPEDNEKRRTPYPVNEGRELGKHIRL